MIKGKIRKKKSEPPLKTKTSKRKKYNQGTLLDFAANTIYVITFL